MKFLYVRVLINADSEYLSSSLFISLSLCLFLSMLFFLSFDFIMSRETISRDTGKLLNVNPVRRYFLPMQRGTHEHRCFEKYVTRNEKRGCYIFGGAFQPTSRTGPKMVGIEEEDKAGRCPSCFRSLLGNCPGHMLGRSSPTETMLGARPSSGFGSRLRVAFPLNYNI